MIGWRRLNRHVTGNNQFIRSVARESVSTRLRVLWLGAVFAGCAGPVRTPAPFIGAFGIARRMIVAKYSTSCPASVPRALYCRPAKLRGLTLTQPLRKDGREVTQDTDEAIFYWRDGRSIDVGIFLIAKVAFGMDVLNAAGALTVRLELFN